MGPKKDSSKGKTADIDTAAANSKGSKGKGKCPPRDSPRLLLMPEPTQTTGAAPDFTQPVEELLQAVRMPPAVVASAEPGTLNSANRTCYRNSIVIMLLSSHSFMSYIQNRLEPHIDNAIASATANNKRFIVSQGRNVDASNYKTRNILLKLNQMYQLFWAPHSTKKCDAFQGGMNRLMRLLSDYRSEFHSLFTVDFPTGEEADVAAFLRWFLLASELQLEQEGRLSTDKTEFEALCTIQSTQAKRCRGCRRDNNVNQRVGGKDPVSIWGVGLGMKNEHSKPSTAILFQLEDLVRYSLRPNGDAWYCEVCRQIWNDQHRGLDSAKIRDAISQRENSNPDWTWFRWMNLPEVLFMSLAIAQTNHTGKIIGKDMTQVIIPEEIDMAAALDVEVPKEHRRLTRYRLRAISLHAGAGFGNPADPKDKKGSKGHYINYVRDTNGQWWDVDDHSGEQATQIPFSAVNKRERLYNGKDVFVPYILCWDRIHDEKEDSKTPTKSTTPNPATSEGVNTDEPTSASTPKRPKSPQTAPNGQQPATTSTTGSTVTKSTPTANNGTAPTPVITVGTQTNAPSNPPPDTATLHLNLTIGDTTYPIQAPVNNWNSAHVDSIRNKTQPAAEWEASIELPPPAAAAATGGKPSKQNNPTNTAPKVGKRFIWVDPAIAREHFLPGDLHATMKRSARKEPKAPVAPTRTSSRIANKQADAVQEKVDSAVTAAVAKALADEKKNCATLIADAVTAARAEEQQKAAGDAAAAGTGTVPAPKKGKKRACPDPPCAEHCPPAPLPKKRKKAPTTAAPAAKKPKVVLNVGPRSRQAEKNAVAAKKNPAAANEREKRAAAAEKRAAANKKGAAPTQAEIDVRTTTIRARSEELRAGAALLRTVGETDAEAMDAVADEVAVMQTDPTTKTTRTTTSTSPITGATTTRTKNTTTTSTRSKPYKVTKPKKPTKKKPTKKRPTTKKTPSRSPLAPRYSPISPRYSPSRSPQPPQRPTRSPAPPPSATLPRGSPHPSNSPTQGALPGTLPHSGPVTPNPPTKKSPKVKKQPSSSPRAKQTKRPHSRNRNRSTRSRSRAARYGSKSPYFTPPHRHRANRGGNKKKIIKKKSPPSPSRDIALLTQGPGKPPSRSRSAPI